MSSLAQQSPRPIRLPWGIHYTWVIVGILAVVQILGSGVSMAAGILVPPLTDPDGRFGWSIGTIGAGMATYFLVGAIFAPVSGWLGDRYGARRMMTAGGMLYGTSMVLLGFISQLWQFFLVFGVLLALTQSISMVPLMASVSGWFRRRLGLGTGILWAAGGIGTAIIAPGLGFLLERVGWQATFWGVGLIGGAIILSLSALLRNRPADVGIKPYGSTDQDPPTVVLSEALERLRLKVFNQHIRRTRAFWNLPVIHGLGCAGHGMVLIFSIPFAVEQGISLTAAAMILSIISLVSILSRLLTPVLAEQLGAKKIMATCLFVQGATVLILFWAQDLWAFYLFAALFGLGFGGEWTGYLVINRQYFGNGPMGTCYGWQMTGALLGHAVTAALGGVVIFLTGSYTAILALSVAFSFGGVAVIVMLESTSRVLIPDWEQSLPPEARTVPPYIQPAAGGPLAEPATGDG
ncbi:MAG: MFS transporter [Chloroflexi bacterium]|nr:MFS transporter [Chloroflexota bacterium]